MWRKWLIRVVGGPSSSHPTPARMLLLPCLELSLSPSFERESSRRAGRACWQVLNVSCVKFPPRLRPVRHPVPSRLLYQAVLSVHTHAVLCLLQASCECFAQSTLVLVFPMLPLALTLNAPVCAAGSEGVES
jgi:hypothetical protein